MAGLISTKNPVLEDHDEIKKRYEEAKAVVGGRLHFPRSVDLLPWKKETVLTKRRSGRR